MLEGGVKHLILTAGQAWAKGDTDALNIKTTDHIDVLEDATLTVTCDWYYLDGTWQKMSDYSLTLAAGRYDMAVDDITVNTGVVHLVKA